MRGVSANTHVPASRSAGLCSAAPLLTTTQSRGACTVSRKTALRSGWSKQAYMRWASKVSNCV